MDFIPATENDFDMILTLEEESFNTYDRLDRKTLEELFHEFRQGFYMIKSGGAIAGYSVFLIDEGNGYIESIAIKSDYRGLGLGMSALRFMIGCICDMGFIVIFLHVRMDNLAAIRLYEKAGFKCTGIVKGFYTDGGDAYRYSMNAG